MRKLAQPFPSSSASGVCGRMDVPSIFPCSLRNITSCVVDPSEELDVGFGEVRPSVIFSTVCRPMRNSIHAIIRPCFPTQMTMIDASSVPAIMGGVPKMGRARAVLVLADFSGNDDIDITSSNMGVASPIDRKRPKNTFVLLSIERLIDKTIGFVHFGFMDTHLGLVNRRLSSAF